MSVCQLEEKDSRRSYPRTCPTCKLSGTCAKGLDRKSLLKRVRRLEKALEPFAAGVYNDNGDITVEGIIPSLNDIEAAYWALHSKNKGE